MALCMRCCTAGVLVLVLLQAAVLPLLLRAQPAAGARGSRWDEDADSGEQQSSGLDRELLKALRSCMDQYIEEQGRNSTQSAQQGSLAANLSATHPPGRNTRKQCMQRSAGARRRRRAALDGSGWTPWRTPRPPRRPWNGGDASGVDRAGPRTSSGAWVTYYGLHQVLGPPRPTPGTAEHHGDVAACALHCAFAKTQLVSSAGLVDEALLVKRLEDSVVQLGPRLAAMRDARDCFVRLGAASDVDDDPCYYTMKLVKCMDLDVLREYHTMRNNGNM